VSRPLRIEYPGAFYHVTSRGNERRTVLQSNRDREMQRSAISQLSRRFAETVKGNQELRKVLGRIAEEDL
jgi:REP-associated tyrosine transposase